MRLALAFALLVLFPAGAQIDTPAVGFALGVGGELQAIRGLAGSFVPGDRLLGDEPALASSFDERGGIVKTSTQIVVFDPAGREKDRWASPSGSAILSARGVLAYFPADGSLWSFAGEPRRIPLGLLNGEVVAVTEGALAVRRFDGVWRLNLGPDGSITAQEAIGGASVPILLLPTGVVFSDNTTIVWRDSSGREKRWETGPVDRLASINARPGVTWLQAGAWAIRLDRDEVFLLPNVKSPGDEKDDQKDEEK